VKTTGIPAACASLTAAWALGVAIQRLLDDQVRRFAYATAALERVRQRYTWPGTAAALDGVYTEVARVRQPTGAVV